MEGAPQQLTREAGKHYTIEDEIALRAAEEAAGNSMMMGMEGSMNATLQAQRDK